ncbi:hypothetical protein ES288_A09G072400v1 [Gossypium darwinii]|uniref:Uncharacterized protein n=2 Tax=Gossypium TaxID=3633 RepID=A0A5D2NZ72_GOSTO|nr:hypothetical protein ES288_A09G072400v1 [Gossypium darwinii]TYI09361.1 hypothetical protein ES332_A09G067500v1 [Gossypium tomentosum]
MGQQMGNHIPSPPRFMCWNLKHTKPKTSLFASQTYSHRRPISGHTLKPGDMCLSQKEAEPSNKPSEFQQLSLCWQPVDQRKILRQSSRRLMGPQGISRATSQQSQHPHEEARGIPAPS